MADKKDRPLPSATSLAEAEQHAGFSRSYYTVREAAKLLQSTEVNVRKTIKGTLPQFPRLPSVKVGPYLLIPRDYLKCWIELSNKQSTAIARA